MTRLSTLPLAAVGAASQAVRQIGHRVEDARRELTEATESFINTSAEEGRHVLARVPGAAKLLGAANMASQPVTDIVGVDSRAAAKLRRAGVNTVQDMWA
ncbi:MAG: hypothetical protein WB239_03105, partial [Acidimicrobiia bacterium]